MTTVPFSLPLHRVGWLATDGGECDVEIRFENEGWTAQGTLGTERAQFVMRISATLVIQQFMLFRDMDEPDLWLGRDRSGRWGEVNGAHRPDLDGCTDIELPMSPFPTSLTMKRLPLLETHAATLTVAAVNTETLEVVPRSRTFARLSAQRWRYTSPGQDREVEVDLDEHGLVVDEPGRFSRRAIDTRDS